MADPEEQGTGVTAILNEAYEDFAAKEAESTAQEETDEKNFQAVLTEQAVEKGRLEQDIKMSTSRMEALGLKLEQMNTGKGHLTKEMEAVWWKCVTTW